MELLSCFICQVHVDSAAICSAWSWMKYSDSIMSSILKLSFKWIPFSENLQIGLYSYNYSITFLQSMLLIPSYDLITYAVCKSYGIEYFISVFSILIFKINEGHHICYRAESSWANHSTGTKITIRVPHGPYDMAQVTIK